MLSYFLFGGIFLFIIILFSFLCIFLYFQLKKQIRKQAIIIIRLKKQIRKQAIIIIILTQVYIYLYLKSIVENSINIGSTPIESAFLNHFKEKADTIPTVLTAFQSW
jgi:hypothetical protein